MATAPSQPTTPPVAEPAGDINPIAALNQDPTFISRVGSAPTPAPYVDKTNPLNNPILTQRLDATSQNKGDYKIPSHPSALNYGDVHQAITGAPSGTALEKAGETPAYKMAAKDKIAYISAFSQHGAGSFRGMKDAALDALYNTCKFAEQDGLTPTIGAGTDGRHSSGSAHYSGEAVDMSFKDKNGNWLPDDQMVSKGQKYGLLAGWGEMRNEWSRQYQPDPNNAHLHFDYSRGAGAPNDPAVTVFRKRETKEAYPPFIQDAGSVQKYAQEKGGPKVKDLPTMCNVMATAVGVPSDLFTRMIQAESNFNKDAVSSAGCIGLGQIGPDTLPALLKQHNYTMEDYTNSANVQLRLSAEYLKQQLVANNGDQARALAAYNAGPGSLANFISGRAKIYPETSNYVFQILHPITQGVNTPGDTDQMVVKGGGPVWDPNNAEHKAAQQLQSNIAGVSGGLLNRFLGTSAPTTVGAMKQFGSNWLDTYRDPANPASPYYQDNKMSGSQALLGKPGTDTSWANWLQGTVEQFGDFAQDIVHSMTMHLLPDSKRSEQLHSDLEGHGVGGFLAGNAAPMIGGFLFYEAALSKLIGSAGGVGGALKVAGGAIPKTAGLLNEGTAGLMANETYRNMLALGGVGLMDGVTSNLADWMYGKGPIAGKDPLHAAGFALLQGITNGLTAMSMVGMGSALGPTVQVLGRGLGATAEETTMMLAKAGISTPAQMAIGGLLGGVSASGVSALSNITGASEAMYGGDIPIPGAFTAGLMGGAAMAPFAKLMPNRLGGTPTSKLGKMLSPLQEALTKKAVEILGPNPELVAQMHYNMVKQTAQRTEAENLAAGQLCADLVGQQITKVTGFQQAGEREFVSKQAEYQRAKAPLDTNLKVVQAWEDPDKNSTDPHSISRKLNDQGYRDYNALDPILKQAKQAYDQAQTAYQTATAPGAQPNTQESSRLSKEVSRTFKEWDALKTKETEILEKWPGIMSYYTASKNLETIGPKFYQADQAFQAYKQEYQAKKIGVDAFAADLQDTHKNVTDGLAEWKGVRDQYNPDKNPDAVIGFLTNKLERIVKDPIQYETPWNKPSLEGTEIGYLDSPVGRKALDQIHQNYRRSFTDAVIKALDRQNDFPTALDQLAGQVIKGWDPKAASAEQVGIGPEIKASSAAVRDMIRYLEGVAWKEPEKPLEMKAPLQEGEKRFTAAHRAAALNDLHFRYNTPDAKRLSSLQSYNTVAVMGPQHIGEAYKLEGMPPLQTEGFFQNLGRTGLADVPHITKDPLSFENFMTHASACESVSQDKVPFTEDQKGQLLGHLKQYYAKLEPLRAHNIEMLDMATQYHQMLRESPLAQNMGLDMSRALDPAYLLSNIHKTQAEFNQTEEIGRALESGDKAGIAKVLDNSKAAWEQHLADLCFTQQELVGFGKYNQEKNSQAVVASADYTNRALGLSPGNHEIGILDRFLNLISGKGQSTFRTLDRANAVEGPQYVNSRNEILANEVFRSIANSPMEGRTPGDCTGLSQILFAKTMYNTARAWDYVKGKIMPAYENLLKETSGELQGTRSNAEWDQANRGRGDSRDQFNKALTGVMEDPGEAQAFFQRYGDRGKAALYYTNKLKSMLETLVAGNPDMEGWMRANHMVANFPKAVAHFLSTNKGVGANLGTGYSQENLRDFTTRKAFKAENDKSIAAQKATGIPLERFKNMSLNERMTALYDKSHMDGMTPEVLEKINPDKYNGLARQTERVTNADLYDQTEDDPAAVLGRQFDAILRASRSRQFFTTLSNTFVDTAGGRGTPQMKGMVHIIEPNGTPPKMWYRDGTSRDYISASGIPGFDRWSTKVDGKEIGADRLYIHPEAYDFLTKSALDRPDSAWSKGVARAWASVNRIVRSYGLMGGYVPHLLANMWDRLGDLTMAPMRAFASDEAGRVALGSNAREFQLATFNAIRSGVNFRTVQEATRGVQQAMMDQLDPITKQMWYGVEDNNVMKFMQAMNFNDPANKAAYNQLGGMKKFFADVLGAPITLDHIAMREGAHADIQAGMIGGFYHQREIFNQTHAKYLDTLAPQARNEALDQMASMVVNQKARALPYYMQNSTFRNAFGETFMSPNYLLSKANYLIDSCDAALGLGVQAKNGQLMPDQMEIASLLKKAGVSERRYSGYSPEIKQAIRGRIANVFAGQLFAGAIGLQVLQHMCTGGNTIQDGRTPDKWTSLKMGDGRFLSGVMPGTVRDFANWACELAGRGPVPALEEAEKIMEKQLIPTDRALGEIWENKDRTGKIIYGDYRDMPVGAALWARDTGAYMLKNFINFEDTMGYKSNTQLSDLLGNAVAGPNGLVPNSLTTKEWLLRSMGMYDSRDNWAATTDADIKHRMETYQQQQKIKIQPYLDTAKILADNNEPDKAQQYIGAAWGHVVAGTPIYDKELAQWAPDGVYRMSQKEFSNMMLRTMNPEAYAASQRRSGIAGLAGQKALIEHEQAQQGTGQ